MRIGSKILLVAVLWLSGCAKLTLSPASPKGFAAYDNKKIFRAVSPDGVLFRIRQIKHEPTAELSYWKEAVQKRMIDAGYLLMGTDSIQMGKIPGALIELASPVGLEDHTYLIAVFPTEKHIVVVEASGDVTEFRARREEILAAINKIEYKP